MKSINEWKSGTFTVAAMKKSELKKTSFYKLVKQHEESLAVKIK
ncbi:hypothetical protein MHH33_14425 [Paenisporosarcina sp. FSL H8-0542]